MDRELATIRIVNDLHPIPGADRIELAIVDGWQCVVKKGEFVKGDMCLYIEIDSILPDIKQFEFMANRRMRVRTIKLCKQISQGLALPLSQFPMLENCKLRDDVTKKLGIVKYERPSEKEPNLSNKKKYNFLTRFFTRFQWYRALTHTKSKSFPSWISKTDEPRVQNIPRVLQDEKDSDFYITEKIDGQSASYWVKSKPFRWEFGVCSRNVRKFEMDKSTWSTAARELGIKKKLLKVGKDILVQGELCGPKIQKNKYDFDGYKFFVFNVFDIKEKKWYNIEEQLWFCELYGFDHVPVLYQDTKIPDNVPEIVKMSKGNSVLAKIKREGIVLRKRDSRTKVSFKAINPEFLLKYGE